MALAFQIQQFPFTFGLNEGVDPHQVPPGTLTTAENVVWKQSGRLEKRFGTSLVTASIIGGGSIASGKRLFCRGSELCLIDGSNLYAYSSTQAAWRSVGAVPDAGITSANLVDTSGGLRDFDTAISSTGTRVDAWVTGAAGSSSAVVLQVVSSADGTLLVAPTVAFPSTSACHGVRVLVIGSTAIVLTLTSGTSISAVTVNLSTLAVSSVTNLRTDSVAAGGVQNFDACVIGTNFVIAYTATGPLLKLYSYNTSLTQQATGGITSEASGAGLISIDGAAGEVLYVAYVRGVASPAPLRIATANSSTLAQITAPVLVEVSGAALSPTQVGVCRYNSTSCIVAYQMPESPANRRVTSWLFSSTLTVTASSGRATYGTAMISRPFMCNGKCWMVLSDTPVAQVSNPLDRSTILVEVETSATTFTNTPHRYAGCLDVLIGGSTYDTLCNAASLTATSVCMALPVQSSTTSSVVRQGLKLFTMSLGLGATVPADLWRTITVGQESFIFSGVLTSYDGRSAFDYGFSRAPAFDNVATSAGTGSIAAGVYLYGALQEYRSATGLLYRSPTQTAGGTVTSPALGTVTLRTLGYSVGNKQSVTLSFGSLATLPTLLPWYRTTVGGTTYQRLTIEPLYNTNLIDQTVASVSLVDTSSDAGVSGSGLPLSGRPAMYTTGGILDDYAPPGAVSGFLHADRLWLLANDQRTWWHSKAFQDDLGTAPGFHPNFRIAFSETQTAGISMDDKAVFFSATGVRYMLGSGPAANGQNSDFTPPITVQSDVGCTNARSVVSMPDGIMFQSARGIYLLTRGLELVWIGRPIKDTLAAYPNVTSATLVASANQVRFTCNDAGTLAGVVLVYDYVQKQWSTARYTANGSYGTPINDACMWNGAWTFVTPAGAVYTESSSSYLDGSTWVPITLETAWISATGPLSFQSMRRMFLHGTSATDHGVTVESGFDSLSTYPNISTFLAQSAVTAVGVEECSVMIGKQRKCQAIRFRIKDSSPTTGTIGTGKGPAFDMLGLEFGAKAGFKATTASKKG